MIKNLFTTFCLLAIALQANAHGFSGSWTGKITAGTQTLTIVFNFSKDDSGKDVCTMDSPDQLAIGLPADIDFISDDSVCVKNATTGVTYIGKLKDNVIYGFFIQNGMTLVLNLKSGKEVVKRPQTPLEPFSYKTEDVTFTNANANVTLAGTLTYPVGYKAGKKVKVALLVTGSGLEDRNENIFEHKPFLVIADYFAKNGIATLRFDDRGFGKSTGNGNNCTTKDFAEDAQAGVDYLKKTGRFSSVGVIGHSEGASIAFMLGAKQKADFVVSMAGVGVKADTALTAQVNKIMELSGIPTRSTVEMYRAQSKATNQVWLNYFIDYDPTADIKGTKCPVLAINGAKDVQVLADLNLTGIKTLMNKDKRSKTILYQDMNHMFQKCATGATSEYRRIETTIEPVVLTDMADWINSL